ncbi:MAG: tetratricopeptide repeat protein [Deltaproteobacteria bacterium]|nr:tetratricopeptide repeat protein [Deltaproteobacteria bacterium]
MNPAYSTSKIYMIISLAFFSLIVLPEKSFAEFDQKPVLKIDSDTQYNFAEYYFSNKEYFRAIGEYKRFIYFFPEDAMAPLAAYKIGESYFKSRRFREAVISFKTIINQYADTELLVKSYFMISECLVLLDEYGPAISNLHNLILITDDVQTKDEAFYKIGWIYLEIEAWENAKLYFSKISRQNSHKYSLKKLSDELNSEATIPKKNPKLAGILSIIPGAGFLYCERYQDALIAFLLNGAIICAAYEAFDNDNAALGGIIAFVGTGFYAGNIYGSVSSAHKYNKNKKKRFIEKLKENTKIRFSADYNNTGVLISFNYLF